MSARLFGVVLLVLLGAPATQAQTAQISAIAIEPAAPMIGEPLRARVEVIGCLQLPTGVHVRRSVAQVRVELDLSDTCDPALVVPSRAYELGGFDAGPQRLDFYACAGNVPPGIEPCTPLRSIEVVVGGGVEPQEIPHAGAPVLGALALLLAIGGWPRLRRRQ